MIGDNVLKLSHNASLMQKKKKMHHPIITFKSIG